MRSDLSPATATALQEWLAAWLLDAGGDSVQRALLVATGLAIDFGGRPDWAYGEIRNYTAGGDDGLLDAVHVTLGVIQTENTVRRNPPYRDVDGILALGRSAWKATEEGLVHRADPTGQQAFEAATSNTGSASDELREAWTQAHARNGNPGDAWDHAIKAVEAALRPIVCQNNSKATLSNVIGELKTGQWKLGVRGRNRTNSTEPLVQMLELLWPDPNRHGSPTREPSATAEEARAVVNLALTIVQWARDGQISRR